MPTMTTMKLADGRLLDVAVSGPPEGVPLVFHHGTPGSVTPNRAVERAAHARGLRLVTFSRAGYGSSTRLPGRSVADVAADVAAVLDRLGAGRCVVAGWSGGGPHALATAVGLPDRVAGVLSIAGVGPYGPVDLDFMAGMGELNVKEFGLALRGEQALRPFLEAEAKELRGAGADALHEALDSLLSPPDRAVLTHEYAEDTAASFTEGLRPGVDGWLDDDLAFCKPWGFDLDALAVPAFVWQGTDDLMVPFAHGRWLAARLPGAVAHLQPGEGHLSIGIGAVDAMFDELSATL